MNRDQGYELPPIYDEFCCHVIVVKVITWPRRVRHLGLKKDAWGIRKLATSEKPRLWKVTNIIMMCSYNNKINIVTNIPVCTTIKQAWCHMWQKCTQARVVEHHHQWCGPRQLAGRSIYPCMGQACAQSTTLIISDIYDIDSCKPSSARQAILRHVTRNRINGIYGSRQPDSWHYIEWQILLTKTSRINDVILVQMSFQFTWLIDKQCFIL